MRLLLEEAVEIIKQIKEGTPLFIGKRFDQIIPSLTIAYALRMPSQSLVHYFRKGKEPNPHKFGELLYVGGVDYKGEVDPLLIHGSVNPPLEVLGIGFERAHSIYVPVYRAADKLVLDGHILRDNSLPVDLFIEEELKGPFVNDGKFKSISGVVLNFFEELI